MDSCAVAAAHDLWGLGATLTELLTGQPLLPANDEKHWLELYKGLVTPVPPTASRDEAEALRVLLAAEPSARGSVRALSWAAGPAGSSGEAATPGGDGDGAGRLDLHDVEAVQSGPQLEGLLREVVDRG